MEPEPATPPTPNGDDAGAPPVLTCAACGFEAKSVAGLAAHTRAKHAQE